MADTTETIAAELATIDDPTYAGEMDGTPYCFFCSNTIYSHPATSEHDESCLWLRVKAFCALPA